MAVDTESLPTDEVPKDLADALRRSPPARKAFERMPPSYRRRYVGWVTEAKREETRTRRVHEAIEQIIAWAEERAR
jgi:uncharacterized protein YdeI (YjbR/CyaY-like superfamily)